MTEAMSALGGEGTSEYSSFPRTREFTSKSLMHRDFQPTVYLLASGYKGTLYLGVTSDLLQRIAQHRDGTFQGFSNRYGVHRLVWFEQHSTMEQAILREKRIKKWRRAWKIELIDAGNPK